MAKVIVTGCAGFIGSHTCRALLKEGHSVYGIDNLSVGFKKNMEDFRSDTNFYFCYGDICNAGTTSITLTDNPNGVDAIFHLAARGELYFCRDSPCAAVENNINGTIMMLELAKRTNCKHFIFSDTSAEYDSVPLIKNLNSPTYKYYPTKEEVSPWQFSPRGTYAITKMAASQLIRASGLPYTLVRYFNVYGPSLNTERDIPPVIGGFAKNLLNGKQCTIYGTGDKRRDFIYIRDVIDLHMKILETEPTMSTFNVGTGENYSIYEIYEAVTKEIFGSDSRNWPSPVYVDEQPGEAEITLADIDRTRRTFLWNPVVNLTDGVAKTVDSMRD